MLIFFVNKNAKFFHRYYDNIDMDNTKQGHLISIKFDRVLLIII
jgi:hypothetical protein